MIHQIKNSKPNYNYNAFIYEDIEWKPHFHKNFELIYSIAGTHTIYIEQKAHTIKTGELILIPPTTMHTFKIAPGTQAWVGVFSADYIALFAKNHGSKMFSKFRLENTVHSYLKQVLFFQGTPELYILKSALYAVCSQCLENASVLYETPYADLKNMILDYISKNFDKAITMQDTAEALGYEYHYFSQMFHKIFSVNFKEFLNSYRYEKACELLEHGDYNITKVSTQSGFQSIRSFNNTFKALSGITPSEYKSTPTRTHYSG